MDMFLSIVKAGLALASGIGASKIVSNSVSALSPHTGKRLADACVEIAGFVMGCMAADAVSDYVVDQIDNISETAKKLMPEKQ